MAPELLDESAIRATVRRAHPHEHTGLGPELAEVMGSGGARVDLYHYHMLRPTPQHDLDVRDKRRSDPVRDQVRQPFFEPEGIVHAEDTSSLVIDADDQCAPSRVREGHNRP